MSTTFAPIASLESHTKYCWTGKKDNAWSSWSSESFWYRKNKFLGMKGMCVQLSGRSDNPCSFNNSIERAKFL